MFFSFTDKICFDKLRVMDCDVSPDSAFENSAKQRILENGYVLFIILRRLSLV
jgi:hypothetical protein